MEPNLPVLEGSLVMGTHGCYWGMYWNATSKQPLSIENDFWIRLTGDINVTAQPWEYFLGFYRVAFVAGQRVEELIVHALTKDFDDL